MRIRFDYERPKTKKKPKRHSPKWIERVRERKLESRLPDNKPRRFRPFSNGGQR